MDSAKSAIPSSGGRVWVAPSCAAAPSSPSRVLLCTTSLVLAVWLATIIACSSEESTPDKNVTFYITAAADSYTPYGLTATYLAERLKKRLPDYTIKTPPVQGSLDALLKMEEKGRNSNVVGISQSDVLYHYTSGRHPMFPTPKPESSVRAVARLFPEFVYPEVVCPESVCCSVDDFLSPKLVCGGTAGSGTLVTTINLQRMLHAAWEELQVCDGSESLKIATLSPSLRIDAARGEKRENPEMTPAMADVLENGFRSVYRAEDVSRENSFPGEATVSVDAVLVVTKKTNGEVVQALTQILSDIDRELDQVSISGGCEKDDNKTFCGDIAFEAKGPDHTVPKTEIALEHLRFQTALDRYEHTLHRQSHWSDEERRSASTRLNNASDEERSDASARVNNAYEGLPIALHKSLRLEKLETWSRTFVNLFPPLVVWIIVSVVLIVTAYFSYLKPTFRRFADSKDVRRAIRHVALGRYQFGVIAVTFVLVHFIVAAMIWLSEYHDDSSGPESPLAFSGVWGTLFWLIKHMVGIDAGVNLHAKSSIVWLAFLKTGYAVASLVLVVTVANRVVTWMGRNKMAKYVVVIGKSESWERVKAELTQGHQWVLVTAGVRSFLNDETYQGVKLEASDPSMVPKSAKDVVKQARGIIVLADRKLATRMEVGDVDLWVARTVQQLRTWQRQELSANSYLPIIAEVKSPHNEALVADVGASQVVCVERFGAELIVQSVSKPTIVALYQRLLATTDDTDEFYFDEIPEGLEDAATFSELQTKYKDLIRQKSNGREGRLPVGLLRGGDGVFINPPGDMEIHTGDRVVVIAKGELSSDWKLVRTVQKT